MGKKTYIIPEVEIYMMEGMKLLDDFSEKTNDAPVINNGELDSNSSTFEEDMTSAKGLWDED